MAWLLTKGGGRYVAPAGAPKSYTTSKLAARRWKTREAAQADACGDETPIEFVVL